MSKRHHHLNGHETEQTPGDSEEQRSLPGPYVYVILQARLLEWVCHFPPPWDLPNPGTEPDLLCLLHCKWILYLLSHQGSLENNLAVS